MLWTTFKNDQNWNIAHLEVSCARPQKGHIPKTMKKIQRSETDAWAVVLQSIFCNLLFHITFLFWTQWVSEKWNSTRLSWFLENKRFSSFSWSILIVLLRWPLSVVFSFFFLFFIGWKGHGVGVFDHNLLCWDSGGIQSSVITFAENQWHHLWVISLYWNMT